MGMPLPIPEWEFHPAVSSYDMDSDPTSPLPRRQPTMPAPVQLPREALTPTAWLFSGAVTPRSSTQIFRPEGLLVCGHPADF